MIDRPTAAELTRGFAEGTDDPQAACERALLLAGKNPGVFIALTAERALAEARASAKRWLIGRPLGPLDGVPIAWKDMIDVRGARTTLGSAIHRERPQPKADADVVTRLSRAGTVSIGKTNLSEFAFSGLGLNPHFGTPINTRRPGPALVPGGSSSGSALSVALGITPLAVGTDTSGSIRVPAAFNGVIGFRPSQVRYARRGVAALAPSLDCVGTMANSARDIVALDAVLCGRADKARLGAFLMPDLIVPEGVLLNELDPDVARDFARSLKRLADAGHRIERRPLASLTAVAGLFQRFGPLVAWEASQTHAVLVASQDFARIDPRVASRLTEGERMTSAAVAALHGSRCGLTEAFTQELGGRLLIAPTVAIRPPPLAPLLEHDAWFRTTNARALRNTMILSFVDAPSLSLPPRFVDADPSTGILVSGAAGADEAVLSAGLMLERALSGDQAARSKSSRARSTAR